MFTRRLEISPQRPPSHRALWAAPVSSASSRTISQRSVGQGHALLSNPHRGCLGAIAISGFSRDHKPAIQTANFLCLISHRQAIA